ncbi:MAG: archaeosortase/exosortase family protein [Kiritimatiellae bacterium]|nr:archaeosortase/exosortase family protein [Kiritimatiellia bacterium]
MSVPTSRQRGAVLAGVGVLAALWLGLNFGRVTGSQHGTIRLVLGLGFALALLLRPKRGAPRAAAGEDGDSRSAAAARLAVGGTLLKITGLVFGVNQLQWLGLIILLFACLRWALPPRYRRDLWLALLLLYWMHPLPGQVFGPLQLGMQRLSVAGAEYLLHLANVRVWADGLVLRTGTYAFDIPAACSGMEAATTVFLFSLGLGLLRRLRWFELPAVVALGLVQALALNVLRVSLMVVLGARRTGDPVWIRTFTHDTVGVLLVSAVLLIVAEIHLWENWKRDRRARREGKSSARDEGEVAPQKGTDLLPPAWAVIFQWKWLVLIWLGFAVALAAIAYKGRPYHRAEMLREVGENLGWRKEFEDAKRVVEAARELAPYDGVDYNRIQLFLQEGSFEGVLEELAKVPQPRKASLPYACILEAYANLGLGRRAEAWRAIEQIPARLRKNPRLAIIMAEIARHARAPDKVAEHVVDAAGWPHNAERIRALFPYLAAEKRWEAIIASDMTAPYEKPVYALLAAQAHMQKGNVAGAADAVRMGIAKWPDDPRFLVPLHYLAVKRFDDNWEEQFTRQFLASLDKQTAEQLYALFETCIRLRRPDLVWLLYRRIQSMDPDFPGLPLAAAKFGHLWFSFRRQYLGLESEFVAKTIDITPFCRQTRHLRPWSSFWSRVPLVDRLSEGDRNERRLELLREAVAVSERRLREGRLSTEMHKEYIQALAMLNRDDDAHAELTRLQQRRPELADELRLLDADLYDRDGDYQRVYEILRDACETERASVKPSLMLGNALYKLRLLLCALERAEQTVRRFPESSQAVALLASVLNEMGEPEEALFRIASMSAEKTRDIQLFETELYYATERIVQAERACDALVVPKRPRTEDPVQRYRLRPAERALEWDKRLVPAAREFEANERVVMRNLDVVRSPYLRALNQHWLAAYRARCTGKTAEPAAWESIGRDPLEKSFALYQLALLYGWQNRAADARAAAERSVALWPQVERAWRLLIALSGGEAGLIARARRACPDDGEIWLAWLVRRVQAEGAGRWVEEAVRDAALARRFSPAVMTRAGEFLLRQRRPEAAAVAARDAAARADGLLPALVLEAQCALASAQPAWAKTAIERALAHAIEPPRAFYEHLVRIRGARDASDPVVLVALRELRRREPENARWAEMLGVLRFQRGGADMVDALYELSAAIDLGREDAWVFVLAAEAARRVGNLEKAIGLLEKARARHPQDGRVLNNLVYTLATEPGREAEAEALLAPLRKMRPNDPEVMDTAVAVYLRGGRLDEAERVARELVGQVGEKTARGCKAALRLAEILFQRGRLHDARQALDALVRSPHCSAEVNLEAGRLLARIELKLLQEAEPPE